MFSCEICKIFKNNNLKNICEQLLLDGKSDETFLSEPIISSVYIKINNFSKSSIQHQSLLLLNSSKKVLYKKLVRSSHRRYSLKKGVLKNSSNFTGKHLCWSLVLIKLQAFRYAASLKSDSNTGVFL